MRYQRYCEGRSLPSKVSLVGWGQTYPEGVATNPTVGVKFEKIPLLPAQSLTPEQMQQVWEVINYLGETRERDTTLVHLLSHGLRAGEIVALNVGAFDGKLLFIADTKNNEPRLVPLKKQSRQALQQYLTWRVSQGGSAELRSPTNSLASCCTLGTKVELSRYLFCY